MATDQEMEQARARFLKDILESNARFKVIVAGPGTGKSHTFKELLKAKQGENLALTFINNLVTDLKAAVGHIATVRTFHAFCRGLLHATSIKGITQGVDYYPTLGLIIVDDISIIDGTDLRTGDIERALHNLDHDSPATVGVLRSGDYYDAVSHTDSVYRMYMHLSASERDIPTYAQIVVDEYQDFSLLEVQFIALLSKRSPTLVVGDDDQALYQFKHASAAYLQSLAADNDWARFQLPFCSRCTSVLVSATHLIVKGAQKRGLLKERIGKDFICYMPTKRQDSERFPHITHAQCTVERNKSPLICRYVKKQIDAIPLEEVLESRSSPDPTVLVIGPKQFARRVYEYLSPFYSDVTYKERTDSEVELLDGYLRLIRNPKSRLGWRIVLYNAFVENRDEIINRAISNGEELADLLPSEYKETHLAYVELVRRYKAGDEFSAEEEIGLATQLGLTVPALAEALERDVSQEAEEDESEDEDEKSTQPRIVVTNLVTAKGLQAPYVFVVGMNNGHFPKQANALSENEVCCFLVAVTRAQRSCTLVSCDRFGNQPLKPSVFIGWIDELVETEKVNAAYFQ